MLLGQRCLTLFDNDLAEVEDAGIRYILRRNPLRQKEMCESRQERQIKFQEALKKGAENANAIPK